MKHFSEYKQLDLPGLSREVLAQWEKEDLFKQSIAIREGHTPFLFFEGPPSANGMPGIHHVLARTIKDTFCRYKTMQGYQVQPTMPISASPTVACLRQRNKTF